MSIMAEAAQLREAIASVAREVIREETRDCLRARKAVVVTPPDGSACTVHFVGDGTPLSLPYSSAVSSVSAGDAVWVLILYGSMRNAIVWETARFD